jgi:hypothetical protein
MNFQEVVVFAAAVAWCGFLGILARLAREKLRVQRRERAQRDQQRSYGIAVDVKPAPTTIKNNRVRNWSDPAVKGFLRGDR